MQEKAGDKRWLWVLRSIVCLGFGSFIAMVLTIAVIKQDPSWWTTFPENQRSRWDCNITAGLLFFLLLSLKKIIISVSSQAEEQPLSVSLDITGCVLASSHFPLFWQLYLDLPYQSSWHKGDTSAGQIRAGENVFLGMERWFCGMFSVLSGFSNMQQILFYILMLPLAIAYSNPEPPRRWFFQYVTPNQGQQDSWSWPKWVWYCLVLNVAACTALLNRIILRNTKSILNILL